MSETFIGGLGISIAVVVGRLLFIVFIDLTDKGAPPGLGIVDQA